MSRIAAACSASRQASVTVVTVVDEKPREGRAPRPSADHDDVHSERWKSIDTGTPWSSKRARSSFSTQ